jgi:hypothetical protein
MNNGDKRDLNNQQMTIKFEVEDTGQGIAAENLTVYLTLLYKLKLGVNQWKEQV